MELEDLKEHIGEKVTINGREFTFQFIYDSGGTWAIFESKKYWIWATLNYEERGVPIDITDESGCVVEGRLFAYKGEVKDWENYVSIVTKILNEGSKLLGRSG